jgi:hypothetical protein
VRFASFFSGGFITAIVVNPPERKMAKCTSVHCIEKAYQLLKSKTALCFAIPVAPGKSLVKCRNDFALVREKT